jgi:hypothetical protein
MKLFFFKYARFVLHLYYIILYMQDIKHVSKHNYLHNKLKMLNVKYFVENLFLYFYKNSFYIEE